MKRAIGILGGTFDPVHHGHLRVALELYQHLGLQEVRLLPCQKPVLAKTAQATVQQRLSMLQLAVDEQKGLAIDERELKRATPSYMIETLISLRAEFADTPLCLILGYDALAQLESWQRWRELLDYAHLVLVPRPDYCLPLTGSVAEMLQHRVKDAALLHERLAGLILVAEVAPLAISSSAIREMVLKGFSPRYLLPDGVLDFLTGEKLYLD